jgi:hypothetical protein
LCHSRAKRRIPVPSSPCQGEDEGEGHYTARMFPLLNTGPPCPRARDSRFCVRILYPPACYLFVIPSAVCGSRETPGSEILLLMNCLAPSGEAAPPARVRDNRGAIVRCAADGRYDFFLTSAPLNVPGGIGDDTLSKACGDDLQKLLHGTHNSRQL